MKWNWKEWAIAAAIRALRTFAQTFVGFIAVGAALEEIQWLRALSVSGAAAVLSILTSLATGLPEVEKKPPADDDVQQIIENINCKAERLGRERPYRLLGFIDDTRTTLKDNTVIDGYLVKGETLGAVN